MIGLKKILAQLRRQEAQLAKQLSGIRSAISSLEFGGGGVPNPFRKGRPAAAGGRRRRRFSAATIAKMRAAQRARWAKVKGTRKDS